MDYPQVQSIPLSELVHDAQNPRTHNQKNIESIRLSLAEHGQVEPLIVQSKTMMVIGGNGRLESMKSLGWNAAACAVLDINDTQARRLSIALNRTAELAGWDESALMKHLGELSSLDGWTLEGLGFDEADLEGLAAALAGTGDGNKSGNADDEKRSGGLVADFGAPPFSILDTRQGYWKERREWWWSTGLDAGIGRKHLVSTANTQADSKYAYMGGRGASTGGSSFDPVLAELLVSWHTAPGETVLDPFAGGPVRGIVSAVLGRKYVGIDVRKEQVDVNVAHWEQLRGGMPQIVIDSGGERPDYQPALTPIECVDGVYVKRDDLYTVAGVSGGKVRSCWALAQGAVGLVTAGSRSSPQVNIVAHIAKRLGIPCRVHTPSGEASPEVADAIACGAERVTHKPGHNSVIIKRARDDADELGWTEIPFGMQCEAAVQQTRSQVADIPKEVTRIVIPVGSGMSLAGVLRGLDDIGSTVEVLGVVVGADPTKRLDLYAPENWRHRVTLVEASVDYHEMVDASLGDILLDPNYEAKCAEHLMPDDLLWIVGIRRTANMNDFESAVPHQDPEWIVGDSLDIDSLISGEREFDALVTCPPYADLERYSDDPKDISTMEYGAFMPVFSEIMSRSVARLRDGAFVAVVVGEIRNKSGGLVGFVNDTVKAMEAAGCVFYNDAILVNSAGTAPIRAASYFNGSRKLVRVHQNVLIFHKGTKPRKDLPPRPAAQWSTDD